MPTTGTAPARVFTGAESANSVYTRTAPKPEVPVRVREGANWFFCIVGLVALDSVFTIFGSHLFRFAGLGITAIVDGLASRSQSTAVMHVIVNGWVAGALLFTGYFAIEGQKAAFAVGMAAYAVDAALLVAAHDYVSVAFHALMLVAIFRGFTAFGQSGSQPSNSTSVAHAG